MATAVNLVVEFCLESAGAESFEMEVEVEGRLSADRFELLNNLRLEFLLAEGG